jgi:hypothetical protein
MTLEELKECDGFTVQVSMDGRDALASISTRFSPDGRPELLWPAPLHGVWEDLLRLQLTDDDIAAFSLNGPHNIFSTIRLSTEGGRHRLS